MNWCNSSVLSIGVGDCSEICYKDPVLKDRPWTAVIDRSPGDAKYSEVIHTMNLFLQKREMD
jgi:hypothetical protein